MRKAIIFYNVTYVIGLYIYPRNHTDIVRITGSFTQFLEYGQALIFLTSRCVHPLDTVYISTGTAPLSTATLDGYTSFLLLLGLVVPNPPPLVFHSVNIPMTLALPSIIVSATSPALVLSPWLVVVVALRCGMVDDAWVTKCRFFLGVNILE